MKFELPKLPEGPVTDQLRAAGRLANEWRDTLVYTVALGNVACNVANGRFMTTADQMLIMLAVWESGRAIGWEMGGTQVQQTAGSAGKPIDSDKFATASAAGMGLANVANNIVNRAMNTQVQEFNLNQNLHLSFFAGLALFFIAKAGGPENILKAYQQMWDWPRRNGGNDGGTTQTQRVVDGTNRFFASLAPRPSANRPVRVALNASHAGQMQHFANDR